MVLMVATLAWTSYRHRARSGAVVLEVPATHLSVGQQFRPEVLSLTPPSDGSGLNLTLELSDSAGHALLEEPLQLPEGGAVKTGPMSLPRSGRYEVRVSAAAVTLASLNLEALPEPATGFGGVTALAAFGVPSGVAEYLRQHGYAVTPAGDARLEGVKLIVVGDARGNGGDLAAAYQKLWQQVDAGTNLLLLAPLPSGAAEYWPRLGPLRPTGADCGAVDEEPELSEGLQADAWQLLRPRLSYDLSAQSALDLYRLDGTRLPRADSRAGYRGCHAVFSYRYGAGWVTISNLPAIEHFQDVRARVLLLNLIRAAAKRRRRAPPSPGLAWVTRERLQQLTHKPPPPLQTSAAIFHRDAPQTAATPGLTLVPISPNEAACWTFKNDAAGASIELNFKQPQQIRALDIGFGGQAGTWPEYRLTGHDAGTADHWVSLPAGSVAANGNVRVTVPESALGWSDFRLTLSGTPAPSWSLCRFVAQ